MLLRRLNLRFNTQPPEGGWLRSSESRMSLGSFNTQPPEGGWCNQGKAKTRKHSFNTQPPEGGWKKLVWQMRT